MTTFKASSIARSQKPMKRSGFKPTAVQMKRSGFTWKRPEKMKRTRMKSRRKPMTKIQASARGEACTIRLPGICMNRTETTVLCHSNQHSDGKGMGLKAPDQCAAYGCFECHAVVDGRAPRPEWMSHDLMLAYFQRGIETTQAILLAKGLLQEVPHV